MEGHASCSCHHRSAQSVLPSRSGCAPATKLPGWQQFVVSGESGHKNIGTVDSRGTLRWLGRAPMMVFGYRYQGMLTTTMRWLPLTSSIIFSTWTR